MAINIFVFKQNRAGSSEVAGMKEAFLPFLTQIGHTLWSQNVKGLLTNNSCHTLQLLFINLNSPTLPPCS